MNEKKTVRDSNIELLRIIAATGVIILHYNNPAIGGAYAAVNPNSLSACFLYSAEVICICAVDLFMMILGRFQSGRNRASVGRVAVILLQVSVVRFVAYLIKAFLQIQDLTLSGVVRNLLPSSYYIITYSVVFVLSPYINRLLKDLGCGRKKLVMILLLLFSVFPFLLTILDSLVEVGYTGLSTVTTDGDIKGYTVVNYILCYIVGAATRDLKPDRRKSVCGYLFCVCILFVMEYLAYTTGKGKAFTHSYSSPFVIGCAFFLLMFFSSITMKPNPYINRIARGSLMVFLSHKHFFPLFAIKKYAAQGGIRLVFHLCLTCICCYVIGWLLSEVYSFCMKPVNNYIEKKMGRFTIVVP